jgi:hypothetical protein
MLYVSNKLINKAFEPKNISVFSRCASQLSEINKYNITNLIEEVKLNKILLDDFDTLFFNGSKNTLESKATTIAYIQILFTLVNSEDLIQLLKLSDYKVTDIPELEKNNITDFYDFVEDFIQYVKQNSNIIKLQKGGEDDDDDDIIDIYEESEFKLLLRKRINCGVSCITIFMSLIALLLTGESLLETIVNESITISDKITSDISDYTNKAIVNTKLNRIIKNCIWIGISNIK